LPESRVDVPVHLIARSLDLTLLAEVTVHHADAFRGGAIARMDVQS
jgi:hypothetical protein